ncbi:hypothetical protein BYT27DRAFT_7257522 [Phlegmacium glaucopus]|nr:hypothetical protein BYT27DRAFT_7257522 [Phlegmacium glaucopus]
MPVLASLTPSSWLLAVGHQKPGKSTSEITLLFAPPSNSPLSNTINPGLSFSLHLSHHLHPHLTPSQPSYSHSPASANIFGEVTLAASHSPKKTLLLHCFGSRGLQLTVSPSPSTPS